MGAVTGGADSTPEQVKLVQDQGQDESIKFGAVNGLAKGETATSKDGDLPKDAMEEWPEPKQIYTFYFVKIRPYDDPKLKAKLDQADKEIQKKNQSRLQITEALRAKKSHRANIISQLKPLSAEDKQFRAIIGEKRKEMEPFQAALGKLRSADKTAKNEGICSSEQELNDRIRSLQFRLQHESNTLSEEKQLLKDIKYLEGTREKVIANAAMKAQLGDSFGQKEEMVGQVKQIGNDLDGVRKEQEVVRSKIKKLEDELRAANEAIETLQNEHFAITQTKDKAHEAFRELLKSRDETNSCFNQNRLLLNNARELAAKNDAAALGDLCSVEVERFMLQWSSSKAFRDDYCRRILSSLDNRQLTRDGRMRNPGEKPIIELARATEPDTVSTKPIVKQARDEAIPPAKHVDPVMKNPKEEGVKPAEDKEEKASSEEQNGSSDDYVNTTKVPKVEEIDPVQLKALKVAEEKAKSLQAQERKKKQAEKAAAKAAAKAVREEEKKQKEREKRARKKAGVGTTTVEESEADAEEDDPKEPEIVKQDSAQVTNVNTTQKTKSVHKTFVSDRSRKVIPKRKKSSAYWVWCIPGAVIALLLAFLAYYYSAGSTPASQSS